MQTDQSSYKYFCEREMYFAELGSDQSATYHFIQHYQIITLKELVLYIRGMANYYVNNTWDAITDFNKVLERCPQFKFCYNNRGNFELLSGLDKQYAINQQDARAYFNRSVHYSNHQMIWEAEEALIDYSQAIEINPSYAKAYQNRGILLDVLGIKEGLLSQQYIQKYQLHERNINYIKLKVKIIQQMDQQISQVKLLIKSKSFTDDQQKQILTEFHIEIENFQISNELIFMHSFQIFQ